MIAEIAKTLTGEYPESNPIICVEAPTGTGKTMAYLSKLSYQLPKASKKN